MFNHKKSFIFLINDLYNDNSCVCPFRYIADLPLEEFPSQSDMGEFLALQFMDLIRGGQQLLEQQQKQQREDAVAAVTNAEEGVDVGLPRKEGNLP